MLNKNPKQKFRFAIDRGGTFTDIVCHVMTPSTDSPDSSYQPTKTIIHKLLSANPNYQDAPLEGIRQIISKELDLPPKSLDPVPAE